VKDLEEKLKQLNTGEETSGQRNEDTPPYTPEPSLPDYLDPVAQHGGNKRYYNWDAIGAQDHSYDEHVYGPSSILYFIRQMSSYLGSVTQHRFDGMDLVSGLILSTPDEGYHKMSASMDVSRWREESLIHTYWQFCLPFNPILNRVEFEAYYDSLWEESKAFRRPSALVDIMLAVCMQHEAASYLEYGACQHPPKATNKDANNAGKWWYRRGQHLLIDELEDPSIMTFQCYLLSVLWLADTGCGAQNMAHSVLATGIRIGIILGLHMEPRKDLPTAQREFRKRLWWTMYALELKFAMDLGRPLAISFSQVTCSLPSDNNAYDHDSIDETRLPPSISAQYVKLTLATRAVYVLFYQKCGQVLARTQENILHENASNLEECAEFMATKIGYLQTWVDHIPVSLKCRRNDQGQPFSTDRSKLVIPETGSDTLSSPPVLLELHYHNFVMCLHRPFITFPLAARPKHPVTEKHAITCVNHAITITNIIHQLLVESSCLSGRLIAFQWQWNATISLVGYILAYPLGPVAPAARAALDMAAFVFDFHAGFMPKAESTAKFVRELAAVTDVLIARAEGGLLPGNNASLPPMPPNASERSVSGLLDPVFEGDGQVDFGWGDSAQSGFEGFGNSLADTFAGLENIGANGETMFDFLDFGGLGET
jgi:hypothetical protein